MAHDVFISYSAKDKAFADGLCATLEKKRIRCWIAPRDVLPGKNYAEALIEALNSSKIMVLVFSSNSNDSPHVAREVERAVNKGIPIIPIRIENVIPTRAMEYFLSSPHWLDAFKPPLEEHLEKLAITVQALLEGNKEKTETPNTQPASPSTSVESSKLPEATPPVKAASTPQANLVNCSGCGKAVSGSLIYCSNCGKKLSTTPYAEAPAGKAVCGEGGNVYCSGCGKAVPSYLEYCSNCGKKMPKSAETTASKTSNVTYESSRYIR